MLECGLINNVCVSSNFAILNLKKRKKKEIRNLQFRCCKKIFLQKIVKICFEFNFNLINKYLCRGDYGGMGYCEGWDT